MQGPIREILELARWAPSGDNTQPWRFEVVGDAHCVVHGHDTRGHCVYDLDGRPSQISLGALLETMAIAASAHGWSTKVARREGCPETLPTFDVSFQSDGSVVPDPLIGAITRRTVQRRAMSFRRLTDEEKVTLERSVPARFKVRWIEGLVAKWRVSRLLFANAKIRLTMPEAYEVHRSIIQWGARFSEDRVPDAALGADPLTTRLMKEVMKSWERVAFFNRYLAGTWMPRMQMDLLPAMACGAHYVLIDTQVPSDVDDHVAAGRAVQRFWLTACSIGLQQQPEMTPLIFESFVRQGIGFTRELQVQDLASRLAERLPLTLDIDPVRAVWMARIGAGATAAARSLRKPLDSLTRDTNSIQSGTVH